MAAEIRTAQSPGAGAEYLAREARNTRERLVFAALNGGVIPTADQLKTLETYITAEDVKP